jgi:hypothetical protein
MLHKPARWVALIALFGIGLSFTESVWAASCMSSMDESSAGAGMTMAMTDVAPEIHGGMPMEHEEQSDIPVRKTQECPLILTWGSCLLIQAPSSATTFVPSASIAAATLFHYDRFYTSAFSTQLFRPPRA